MKKINNMTLNEKSGVAFLTFPEWEQFLFVTHAFTTRLGGVSKNEFSSMNMNFNRGDSDENVLENYHRICNAAGFPFEKLVASSQDHHTFIRRITTQQAGIGIWKPKDLKSVDGLCTNEPGVTLVTYYADCVPLYFMDPVHRAVGLAHAGWRGTATRIGEEMVKKMQLEFGSLPKDLYVAIGPSIGSCCYEVDEPVASRFFGMKDLEPNGFVVDQKNGKYLLDLWECNKQVLHSVGVLNEHITIGGVCTKCHSDLLFSHRVTGAARGGMAAMICIKE